ncbi:hypothetical protein ACJJTC_013159 [Scirpophaga incertulas]
MIESCPEARPLLSEESPEDQLKTSFSKRLQPMVSKGRARVNAKGAVAIIRFWPEHWASAVTIWWIALTMVAMITFIIYNTVLIVTTSPIKYFKDYQTQTLSEEKNVNTKELMTSKRVYMHLLVDINTEVHLDDYLTFIDVINSRYPDITFAFYILVNDSTRENSDVNAAQNNKNALKSLWPKDDFRYRNISIYHLLLSEFMENTPLQNYWKNLPTGYVEFLIRAVSIWDKGGIAFSPNIITNWSKSSYKEKIFKIFDKYHISKDLNNKNIRQTKNKKKINNIRDVIEFLENQSESEPPIFSNQNPIQAESKNTISSVMTKYIKASDEKSNHNDTNIPKNLLIHEHFNQTTNVYISSPSEQAIDLLSIKPNVEIMKPNQQQKAITRKRKHIISNTFINHNLTNMEKGNFRQLNSTEQSNRFGEETNRLTIDLNGNILASLFPCHVFLGSLFSHLRNHVNISVTDFIYKELTYFCKDIISNCNGIDVIVF